MDNNKYFIVVAQNAKSELEAICNADGRTMRCTNQDEAQKVADGINQYAVVSGGISSLFNTENDVAFVIEITDRPNGNYIVLVLGSPKADDIYILKHCSTESIAAVYLDGFSDGSDGEYWAHGIIKLK